MTAQPQTGPDPEVRRFVRELLQATPSYQALSAPDRVQLAKDMVQVMSYLSDPAAGQAELGEAARAQGGYATPGEVLRDRLAAAMAGAPRPVAGAPRPASGTVVPRQNDGQRKQVAAGANQVGAETFSDLVGAVDFVGFVSGLIEGVFTSIVNSSIRQMQEYAKFLETVSKSVQEFANDHVKIEEAQDFLQARFPKALKISQSQEGRKLEQVDDPEGGAARPDFKSVLGIETDHDVNDEEGQKKLVVAAQLKLARMRQQQMATMVTMGINRIVVTEGEIRASVLIDVKAKDIRDRTTTQDRGSQYNEDSKSSHEWKQKDEGGWFSGESSSSSGNSSRTKAYVSTSHLNSVGKDSSTVESNAKLSGFVQVKFKSDYFPLEKLASMQEMEAIQEKSKK